MNSSKPIQYVPPLSLEGSADRQFFYGVDWASIRDIDAPFVPHLRSITDTSYFPTDEIDQTSDLPVGADAGDDAKKDLAFLGYTYVYLCSSFSPEIKWAGLMEQVPSLRNALRYWYPLNFTHHALLRLCMYLFTILQESIDLETAEGEIGSEGPSGHFDPVIGELTSHDITRLALDCGSVGVRSID